MSELIPSNIVSNQVCEEFLAIGKIKYNQIYADKTGRKFRPLRLVYTERLGCDELVFEEAEDEKIYPKNVVFCIPLVDFLKQYSLVEC